tara:strand:- start:257 stop:643 length:387 start_codon:yes stop_codon:yes gene_type:complete
MRKSSDETSISESYKKQHRLRSSKEFQNAFDKVYRRQSGKCFTVLFSANNLSNNRLGLIVPKKHVSLAVDRNKIKREIRTFFRCYIKNNFFFEKKYDVIVLAKSPAQHLNPKQLKEELNVLWNRLKKK